MNSDLIAFIRAYRERCPACGSASPIVKVCEFCTFRWPLKRQATRLDFALWLAELLAQRGNDAE
jgi:rRNA maturation endonuclease Nob1